MYELNIILITTCFNYFGGPDRWEFKPSPFTIPFGGRREETFTTGGVTTLIH